jgi:hypothetical protein
MDESFVELLKELCCGPCKNDRGIEKFAHVMWFMRDDRNDSDEVVILPLCLQCAKMVFSRFEEPIN